MSKMLIGEVEEAVGLEFKRVFAPLFAIQWENNGLHILDCLRRSPVSVIVLDVNLPGLDGISIARAYRASGGVAPILLLGDTHCSLELQGGLDAGADSYLAKPLRMDDVAAHVRALMRRPALRNERILCSGGIEMDTAGGTVSRDDVSIHLHPMEYKLLQFLMRHPNQVFSTHALFERVWQKDFGSMEDTVRTHVRTLRQKIDAHGSASVITTVRGLGYKTIQL
ncbi:MAG: response regulator transcription factor [Candidatus Obscuribacterales bacterium]|nr:response regulator transcription factor [Candidatus Obscuribacterales bacterium]